MTTARDGSGRPRRAVARSGARLAAVQALFQIDNRGAGAEAVVEEFRHFRLTDSDTLPSELLINHAPARRTTCA